MKQDAAPDEHSNERHASLPVGVVIRRSPGVTRWAKWAWRVVAVLPGAGPGNWKELRRDGDAVEYHAATATLTIHRSETEAYIPALGNTPPLMWVILRTDEMSEDNRPEVLLVTASAYEAQDYSDNGEDLVEPIPMPEGIEAWVGDFVARHHKEEAFVKRKRRRYFEDLQEDGKGDARVRQLADVYRAPGSIKSLKQ